MIQFDLRNPSTEAVRRVILERLRTEPDWHYFDTDANRYNAYVEFIGDPYQTSKIFILLTHEVLWTLIFEGILALGFDHCNLGLPWFHRTEYGKKVLASETPTPHDPTGYLERLSSRVPNIDATVEAYLRESLMSFRKGNLIASTVMLGVAAERVFDLLCESLLNSLNDGAEKSDLERILNRFPMKPKLDWVHNKIQAIQQRRVPNFPDNASLMVTTIYDLIRLQRNELGHPREVPPLLDREETYINLLIFPRYYETAETLRIFLSS